MKPPLAFVAIVLVAAIALAADTPTTLPWTARATSGAQVTIPIPGKVAAVAFLRVGQDQSDEAVREIAQSTANNSTTDVIVVISGQTVASAVDQFIAAEKIAWPVLLDPDYALAGRMSVRVWPTTLVIASDGTEVAHLAGLPQSFAVDLPAYIDFAAKKINRAALQQRLATTRQAVSDSPEQMAARHARIAADFFDKNQPEQASAEIEQGLRLAPNDAGLRVAQVRALLKQKRPDAGLAAADQLKDVVPPWQVNLLRAEALIALARWPEAKAAAGAAIELNPTPASAYYQLGLVLAHEKDWEHATESFRRAYESTQPK